MTDRADQIQKAVRDIIIADATIMTTHGVNEVYDIPSPSAPYPYIRVSDIDVIPQAVKGEDWFDYFINIHVWDQDDGTIRTRQILGRLYDLFHRQTLSLPASCTPATYVELSQVLLDPDRVTHHGIIRIRVSD